MAYIPTEQAADIRARLKEAFPLKTGWKFSVKKDGHIALRVTITRAPVDLVAYDFDPYAHDDETPRSASQAKHMGRTTVQTSGGINHHWFRETYTPETVAILEKIIGIVMRDHWDESDSMTDYFHCAWYQNFEADVAPATDAHKAAWQDCETRKACDARASELTQKKAA